MAIGKTEHVNIVYNNNKIIVNGESFTLEFAASMTSLVGIYSSGAGTSTAKLTLKEEKKTEDPVVEPAVIPVAEPVAANTELKHIPEPISSTPAMETTGQPTKPEEPESFPIQEIIEEEPEEEAPKMRRGKNGIKTLDEVKEEHPWYIPVNVEKDKP